MFCFVVACRICILWEHQVVDREFSYTWMSGVYNYWSTFTPNKTRVILQDMILHIPNQTETRVHLKSRHVHVRPQCKMWPDVTWTTYLERIHNFLLGTYVHKYSTGLIIPGTLFNHVTHIFEGVIMWSLSIAVSCLILPGWTRVLLGNFVYSTRDCSPSNLNLILLNALIKYKFDMQQRNKTYLKQININNINNIIFIKR